MEISSKSSEPDVRGKMKWHFSSYQHIYKKSRLEKFISVSLVEKGYKEIISVENSNLYFNESLLTILLKFCDKWSTDKRYLVFFSQSLLVSV